MHLQSGGTNEDSSQSAHPRSLISVFIIRMKKPDQNLRWARMYEGTFFVYVAQVCYYYSDSMRSAVCVYVTIIMKNNKVWASSRDEGSSGFLLF